MEKLLKFDQTTQFHSGVKNRKRYTRKREFRIDRLAAYRPANELQDYTSSGSTSKKLLIYICLSLTSKHHIYKK